MQLSAEVFRQIVDTFKSDERNCTRHELRKEGRVGLRCTAVVIPRILEQDGPKPFTVSVRDISPSGMGFITSERIATGAELVCYLQRKDLSPIFVVMTVRHTKALSKGLYSVGVSFKASAFNDSALDEVKHLADEAAELLETQQEL